MVYAVKGHEPLNAFVNVRVTSTEKATLADDADMAGMSVSALIRARYFGRPIVANADQVMIKELRRLGGLLKSIHLESNGAYSAETALMLRQISDYITSLSAKK